MDPSAPTAPPTISPAPKTSIMPVILSVFLCISLAGIGLLIYQNLSLKKQLASLKTASPSQPAFISPKPVAKADDLYREPNGSAATANWKTYTNEKYQYSFKYPYSLEKETTITDPDGEYAEYRLETPYKGYRISVFSYNANTPNRRPAFKIGDYLLKTISEEEAQIADQHTKKVTDSEDIMVQIGPVTYGTSYHFIVLTSFQRHNGEEEFDQILSTFKFTN